MNMLGILALALCMFGAAPMLAGVLYAAWFF